ncbi:MAG: rRNA maturation RNase YbeY [Candidatus Colwellbacteria bacterium CG10_big_fil_rev_8_21_14_0_10_41_28]|uniref:Endoribonuclease YbeY n=1 Tax=Candidatus Colwellbacteria bacterium CG10_big_fil_rev_8_21_14_0_10_41_28 TaxID=1974539 RepID=A0A2H0VH05_9BACT|nr:MAG: rRNA maturation RNase YbeY [Candidatus Colwellbacteria bacterium CG10_big_fil_rev_8_21_14_0_10_41_28]
MVEISSLDKRFDKLVKPLKKTAKAVFKYLDNLEDSDLVEVYLVNGKSMRKLNREYRGKDKVTDVIAVEYPDNFPEVGTKRLGEIYLNPPEIENKPYNIDYAFVHGLLHLLGFNHQKKSDKISMEKLENSIILWLNQKS